MLVFCLNPIKFDYQKKKDLREANIRVVIKDFEDLIDSNFQFIKDMF